MAERLAMMMSIAVTVAAVAVSLSADLGSPTQNESTNLVSNFNDEYEQSTDELNNWLDMGEKSSQLKSFPILGVASESGIELFVPLDRDHAYLADAIKEKLRQTHPGLDIIIDVVVIDSIWGGERLEVNLP